SGVTASGFAFSARAFGGTGLGSSCTPNTESSDVRFFALIDLLQFLANPFPEIPDFLSCLTVGLKLPDTEAPALRILIRIANNDEMGANHAEHRETLLRLGIAIAPCRGLREDKGGIFLQPVNCRNGGRRRLHVARRRAAWNDAEVGCANSSGG